MTSYNTKMRPGRQVSFMNYQRHILQGQSSNNFQFSIHFAELTRYAFSCQHYIDRLNGRWP